MTKSNKFSPEVRERTVRMVQEHRADYPSLWAAIESIAPKIGCVPQTLNDWVKPAAHALTHHSDRGSQYVCIRYTEHLDQAGIKPSVGSRGDSYDNALAETINGLYKAELIHRRGPWKTRESVELATLQCVHWFNHVRLLTPIGGILPAEAEANYRRQLAPRQRRQLKPTGLLKTRGVSACLACSRVRTPLFRGNLKSTDGGGEDAQLACRLWQAENPL